MDIKTLLFALALGNLALCALLFFGPAPTRQAGLRAAWLLAKPLQAVAWLLLALRAGGLLGDSLAFVFGYPLLFAGLACEAGAHWEAAGRTRWRRPLALATGAATALYYASFWADDSAVRALSSALILSAAYGLCAAALARRWREASLLRQFLAVAIGLCCLLLLARGAQALLAPEGFGWLSAPAMLGIYFCALYLLLLLSGGGAMLLAQEQLQAELARLAVLDPQTEVPNRRGFFQALGPWLALARRPGLPTALIVLDLDQFKRINDGYGLAAGDVVLRAMADVLRRQLRDSDQLGRLTGVEFAILLPRTGLAEAVLVAERVRAAIAAQPVKTERALIQVTASLGVTTIRPDDSTVSLFKRADEALRTAKAAGRNAVVAASEPAPIGAA
ncbi:GGDEF domain-containing protein [Massilia sp. TS11]|uniref:GGDEF domain-containing protein n=1 Tax=Massilia sp. TS11 TaxID=2908003 RepID=UPI001EDC3C72|nr:GGDEF domain-containing protein [Massilia sp. TS11]MCG2584290.1 GGDEF domain-containing protein [Massilia sp. TS11]